VTFNHGVEGSSPSALTNEINYLVDILARNPEPKKSLCTHCVHTPGGFAWASLLNDTDTIGLFVTLIVSVALLVAGKLQRH
jgi:hypothetical protein